jgi:G2/mitotic-specific cyclin-B, other
LLAASNEEAKTNRALGQDVTNTFAMTSNRNGNVLEAGEKDAPIKINCREDPSKNICKNETVTHEIIVAKSSRIAWEETSKNTIVPIAQQPSAP